MDIWIFCRYFLVSQSTLLLLAHKYLVSGSILACMEFYMLRLNWQKPVLFKEITFLELNVFQSTNVCQSKRPINQKFKLTYTVLWACFICNWILKLFLFQENGRSNWCKKVLAKDEPAYPGTEGKTRDQFKLFTPNISRSKVSRGPCKYPIASWQLSYCFHQTTEPFLII